MNDYKELIKELRNQNCLGCEFWDDAQGCASISTCVLFLRAADAIERLVKEGDAAVAELKDAAVFPCRFCKKEHTENCDCYTAHDKWEWRGVKEDNDGQESGGSDPATP